MNWRDRPWMRDDTECILEALLCWQDTAESDARARYISNDEIDEFEAIAKRCGDIISRIRDGSITITQKEAT